MTYMLSAPIMNPIVAISTLTAFKEFQKVTSMGEIGNATMTISRLSLGYVVAVLVGLFILRFTAAQLLKPSVVAGIAGGGGNGDADEPGHTHAPDFNGKLVQAMRTAMRDFLDTGMYFTIGVCITSVFNTQVNQAILDGVAGNNALAIPSLMGLAFILSLCSTSDAFIAAPMGVFSNAAKLAFLVFGPMMDVKLIFMYSAVFKRRVVIAMLIGLFLLVGVLAVPWMSLIQSLAASKP
jgi:uncharacterized protein